ncbi:hypothetical protein RIF29_13871 [Crotalaria pallida]|uniref:RING-type E3 ubiquitin transferase n=1 Tax=Crotalaria pallida TaxID=3830 RepID=A0AAN9IHQ1_CROPI
MASSLEELLAKDGFKGSSRRVTRSRSSVKYDASTDEPLYPLEEQKGRLSVSSERTKTHRTKSDSVARYPTRSSPLQSDSGKNRRPRDSYFIRDKRDEERLKNEIEQKPSSSKSSGKGIDNNSSEYMARYEITEDNRVKDNHSSKESNPKRGKEKNFNELMETKKRGEKLGEIKSKSSYTRSSSNKNKDHATMQPASGLALDEVAVQAVVSILNGYIKRFQKDEYFRSTLRHNCFSSFNFIELQEENDTETKVIRSIEHAIETIEQTAEESLSLTYLKRAMMQLSIITGLSLNDLKHGCTCGIPNYKLSACAHLYLSVAYMIQKKDKVSAKHLLQVFCDSPFQARTILLPELWEHLLAPNLSHLKAWYNKEAEIVVDTLSKRRKAKLLEKVYNEHLDSGTRMFALYYKDWLSEGVESPSVPLIGTPSIVSVTGSSLAHSFESGSSSDPFSPQSMVSKKLYDSLFGGLSNLRVHEDNKDNDDQENCVIGSYGSTIVKQTLTYETERVEFRDQVIEGFSPSVPVDEIYPKGTSMTAVEEWKERNLSKDINNSFFTQTNILSQIVDAVPADVQINMIGSDLEGPCFPCIPPEFICPLTGNVFEEPVTLETGQTFERESIKSWFEKGNKTCPVTGINLEYAAMPLTNHILKRLIDNWKSENLNLLLDYASQAGENSKELLKKKSKDEANVFKLKSLFSSLNEEDKSVYAKNLFSFGGLSFLFRRFELGNVEEKSDVVALLLYSIEADSGCMYKIARNINRKCLLELLHSKDVTPVKNAILLLIELLSMKRRKDVTSFISGLAGEDVFKTMQILLMYLKNSSPQENSLIAVLLLHFDILVEEPKKFSIYREVAVNAIAVALDASLNDEKARVKCCKALLILCGHFSSTGKILTKNSILKQGGCNSDSSELKPLGNQEEGLLFGESISSEDEEERGKELLPNLLEPLIGDGESPFLKTIARCLDSRHLDLVRACVIAVTWLSSSPSMLFNAGLHLTAFLAIISHMKGILENGELELKILASMCLFNFSQISECRTLLKTMAKDICPLLHALADVTWTAKQLQSIMSLENV